MSEATNINFDFLERQEGGVKLNGYVPVCTPKSIVNKSSKVCYQKSVGTVIGNSGVTIVAGLDLGQQSEKGLRNMGIPEDLIKDLKPYLGLRRVHAKTKLEEKPLQINSQQARIINQKVKDAYAKDLRKKYNKKSKVDFNDLPLEAQTAVFSFYYQNGWNDNIAFHKKFYDAALKQDWKAAAFILNDAKQYIERRKEEAQMLEALVPAKGDFNIADATTRTV
jgi:hypothetical protein